MHVYMHMYMYMYVSAQYHELTWLSSAWVSVEVTRGAMCTLNLSVTSLSSGPTSPGREREGERGSEGEGGGGEEGDTW